jgi:DNA polymerase III epsilon subunit-like protein
MFVVFDTETTGLPRSFKAPASDVENWPRVVQLAWEAYGVCGRRALGQSNVIRPDGFTIPKDVEKVHGISTEFARRNGLPIARVLEQFLRPVGTAFVVVAHNFAFDANVLGAEFYRLRLRDPLQNKPSICTMLSTTSYCAIPNRHGFKWPKLDELHMRLFGRAPAKAHDAGADAATCAKCLFELRRRGVVDAPTLNTRTCAECRVALRRLDISCTTDPPTSSWH